MKIAVLGLGKLGVPLAAILARAGHDVTGVDTSAERVALVNNGHSPVEEPGLADVLREHGSRLRATTDAAAAAADTDVSFIVVPTPSDASGAFSNRFVLNAIARIGEGLCRHDRYHVIVVTSTVMPLSTDGELIPALEHASGRTIGATLGLCYNPEFIALGSVIHDLMHPDFVLIGESDARAGAVIEALHRSFVPSDTPICRMTCVNAEIAKIAVNTFVTTKISYANMLAELCERLPGGDVDIVTDAIGIDRRIGPRYLKGATGYGGPCFPRDNSALAAAATRVGAQADIALATDAINRRQVDRLLNTVRRHAGPRRMRIAVLGLSYKPDTPVVDESQGVMLANRLAAEGFEVTAYDPAALDRAAAVLAPAVKRADSLPACVKAGDILVVAVPWPVFREIPGLLRGRPGSVPVILDCWRLLDPESLQGLAELAQLGKGAAGQPVPSR
jgi:UDPglucose 6-dehydrogenase